MAIQAQLYSENSGFPLVGSQDWIDNAYGFNDFYLNLPQKQQITQHPQQFINLPQNSILLPKNNKNCYQSSMALSAQFEKQRQEIDRFITLQNQKLILALEEQRKQQVAMLLRKYEAKTHFLMKHKDEEIEKAMQRTMELEDFLRRVEFESQTWQRVAKENEAIVINLNNKIEELRENACFSNGVEDAESCCDYRGSTEYETEENRGHKNEEQRTRKTKMGCKSCNYRNSCVVFLPCRHLCSCKACVAFLDSCPVCGMPKKAIIEALV